MERLEAVSLIRWHCDSARESPTNRLTTTKEVNDVVGNLSREKRSEGKLKNCAVSLNKKLYLHEGLQHESKQRHINRYLHHLN